MMYEFWYERLPAAVAAKHIFHIPAYIRRVERETELSNGEKWTLWFFRDVGLYCKESYKMPKKGRTNATGNSKGTSPRKGTVWANVPLTKEDEPAIEELLANLNDLYGELAVLFEQGHDINLSYKPSDDAYVAMVFMDDPDDESRRIGLSGWSSDPHGAVAALLYKLIGVARRDLAPYIASPRTSRFR
jgi:hypothetical protein